MGRRATWLRAPSGRWGRFRPLYCEANPALLIPILGGLALMLLSAVALTLGQPARIARVRAAVGNV